MIELEQACESFKTLLQEQLDRIAKASTEKVDFTTKEVVTIGITVDDTDGDHFLGGHHRYHRR